MSSLDTHTLVYRLISFQSFANCISNNTLKHIGFQSGIPSERLLLSLEPEAASLFCKYLPAELMTEGANRNVTYFQPNAKYLVIDAGGMRVL